MKGIKPHTHEEREKIIQQFIPKLQEKFGDNFIALAADGSFAREEDINYSDLELVAFFKEIPKNWSYRKIIDGLLIVIVAERKETYIEKYLDISDVWYASGAGKLLTILNEEFIHQINSYIPENIEEKCLKQIQNRWPFFQEITAKVLNNIQQQNTEAFALTFPQMIKELLIVLSYLNQTPYVTLGSYIPQAKQFFHKPDGFNELIELFANGNIQDREMIKNLSEKVFSDLENILEEKGLLLYQDDLFSVLDQILRYAQNGKVNILRLHSS